MRVVGYMCVRNEVDRYLYSAIHNALGYLDDLFVYDDQSDDGSANLALDAGAIVAVRPDTVPSFVEHEGRFRQAAYDAMCDALQLEPGVWVLAIDADECLISSSCKHTLREAVDKNVEAARSARAGALVVEVPEFFGVDDDGVPLRRMDGQWGRIRGTRLFEWQPGGVFADRKMACGSEPSYVVNGKAISAGCLYLTHWGYVNEVDRKTKYERYSRLPGHSNAHVESILKAPSLEKWMYPVPVMYRGDEL